MDYLGKGEMLTNRDVNTFVPKIGEIRLLRLCNISGILFQMMKHGINTLHVAFLFLYSVIQYIVKKCVLISYLVMGLYLV